MGTTNSNSKKKDPQRHVNPDNDFKFQNLIYESSEQTPNISRSQNTQSKNGSTQPNTPNKQQVVNKNNSDVTSGYETKRSESHVSNFDKINSRSTRIKDLNKILNKEIENYQLGKQERFQRKNNQNQIPKKKKRRKKTEPESVIMGIWIGVTISLIIVLIVIILINHLSIDNDSRFTRDFPTWRGIAIWIFYLWMLGFDVYIFEKFEIRYKQILKIAPNHQPEAVNIFRIAGFHSSVFVILFLFYVMDITRIYHVPGFTEEYYALISWGLYVGFLFLPVPFLSNKGRFFVISLFIDSLLSPFRGVTFPVNWMTDQAVSMAVPLKDLEYTICYYTELDFKSSYNICQDASRVSTVLIVAVSVCSMRIIQCMRQGYDKGQFFMTPFFFNAIKYGVTISTAVAAFEYKLGADQIQTVWLLSAFISSLYSFTWDIKMDWDFLQRNRFHPLLREKLTFGSPKLYYLIMVGNFIMRLFWIITISPTLANFLGNINLVFLITGMVQIFRRGVWNLIRVEKEHIALVSKAPTNNNQVELRAIQLQKKLQKVEKSLNLQIKILRFFKKIEENRQNVSVELQRLKQGDLQKSEALVDTYNKHFQQEDMTQISTLMEQILKSDSFFKKKMEDELSITTEDKKIYKERLLKVDGQNKLIKREIEQAQQTFRQVERIKAQLKQIGQQHQ